LTPEERERQLLALGAELFTRYSYDELSMAKIAREGGISKSLLFHYFPTKKRFFEATLRQAAEELAIRTEPDPSLPPLEQLASSLDAFLAWIEEFPDAYANLMRSATSVAEVRDLIEDIRGRTSSRILEGLHPDGAPPRVRAVVRAWLWFMDGACLDWIEHRDMERTELRDLLLGTLLGALQAASAQRSS
jgi:AcrR family transcriptional regulator